MASLTTPGRGLCGALAAAVLILASPAIADDEFTLYELLDPASHAFAIVFDVTTSRAGQMVYLNGVRAGAEVLDERVIDRTNGLELDWELIDGATAKSRGLRPASSPDEARYLAVKLSRPVPVGGEARLRIYKTYVDADSYRAEGDQIVFARSLGIRANAVVLPAGYELIGSSVPVIVSTIDDGRTKVSMLNDRQDALGVRLVGRRRPTESAGGASESR